MSTRRHGRPPSHWLSLLLGTWRFTAQRASGTPQNHISLRARLITIDIDISSAGPLTLCMRRADSVTGPVSQRDDTFIQGSCTEIPIGCLWSNVDDTLGTHSLMFQTGNLIVRRQYGSLRELKHRKVKIENSTAAVRSTMARTGIKASLG